MDLHYAEVLVIKTLRSIFKLGVFLILALQAIRMIQYHFLYARALKENLEFWGIFFNSIWNSTNVISPIQLNWNYLLLYSFLSDLTKHFVLALGYLQLWMLAVSLVWWRCATCILVIIEIIKITFLQTHTISEGESYSKPCFAYVTSAIIIWVLVVILSEKRSLSKHVIGITPKPLESFVVDKNKARFGFIKDKKEAKGDNQNEEQKELKKKVKKNKKKAKSNSNNSRT